MARLYDFHSRSTQLALTDFSTEFDKAFVLGEVDAWATRYGLTNTSRSIKTTYPIPISAAGYKQRRGDDRMRDLYERSLSMSPVEWTDGVQAKASKVIAPDFVGWNTEPANMAREAARHPNVLVASMLHANPLLDFYREESAGGSVASTIRLFANNHPVNVLDSAYGTFDNMHTIAGFTDTTVSGIKTRFRARKGPNGRPLGLSFSTLLVPPALEQEAAAFFESDKLALTIENAAGTDFVGGVPVNNRHNGTVEVVTCPELEDDDICYALDSKLGLYPWVIQTGGAPEEIRYDESDAKYKDTGYVGLKYVLLSAAAAAMPAGIEQITVS